MPKSIIEEALAWLKEQEKEAQNDMELCEAMGESSDVDYNQGRYEAYGVAVSKIGALLNGAN